MFDFLGSGKSVEERREAGRGFVLWKDIASTLDEDPSPVNDKIMTASEEETTRYIH